MKTNQPCLLLTATFQDVNRNKVPTRHISQFNFFRLAKLSPLNCRVAKRVTRKCYVALLLAVEWYSRRPAYTTPDSPISISAWRARCFNLWIRAMWILVLTLIATSQFYRPYLSCALDNMNSFCAVDAQSSQHPKSKGSPHNPSNLIFEPF